MSEYYSCRGCGRETIYTSYCSDCQVDMQVGAKPGTFYREEKARDLVEVKGDQMTLTEMYANIAAWKEDEDEVITDDTAGAIVGEFDIVGTIVDADAMRDEIITMSRELENPIELSALLSWLYFYCFANPPVTA